MGKKTKKSFAELEMESYANEGTPDIHVDRSKAICAIIDQHMAEITSAKRKYLKDDNIPQYERYAEVEAAFSLLIGDLKKEGLYTNAV